MAKSIPQLPEWIRSSSDQQESSPKAVTCKNVVSVMFREAQRAQELIVGAKRSYKQVFHWHVGNYHDSELPECDWLRSIVACVSQERIMSLGDEDTSEHFQPDVVRRARYLRSHIPHLSGYSHPLGYSVCRKLIAKGINARDEYTTCSTDDIILFNGATEGFEVLVRALAEDVPNPGVLLPMPTYAVLNNITTNCGATPISYTLHEEKGWEFEVADLEEAYQCALKRGYTIKALVIIHPHNPTGMVLSLESQTNILLWCERKKLVLIADEVYQDNVFGQGAVFTSFSKVRSLIKSEICLFSLNSASKGWAGCGGYRGAYCHIECPDRELVAKIMEQRYTTLGPNTFGQMVIACIMTPPRKGDESYESFCASKRVINSSLKSRADLVFRVLNGVPGMSCQPIHSSIFAYPRLHLPQSFVSACSELDLPADLVYAKLLLDQAGICTLPGCGVGQEADTYHLRFHIMEPEQCYLEGLDRWKEFHVSFMKEWATQDGDIEAECVSKDT